jgi:Bacterial lectin
VAGSSWYAGQVPSSGLHATFTAVIGGGTDADGMTFTLLDPAKNSTDSLGVAGKGLGYSGPSGVAVTLDTYQNAGDRSANFVAVATSGTGAALTYARTSTAVSNLRTGTHAIDITVTSAGHVLVTVDGAAAIDVAVTLPPNVIVGFTAATGGKTDQHTARNVVISY